MFGLLAYMAVSSGAGRVFKWFANMTSVAGLMSWFGIAVIYLRFYAGMKAQGMDRTKLPYYSRLQPYAAWYAATSCLLICFFSGWAVFLKPEWEQDTFITHYFPLAFCPVLYAGAYLWKREPFRHPDHMDFISGLDEAKASSYDEPPPRNWAARVWAWLVRILWFFTVNITYYAYCRCRISISAYPLRQPLYFLWCFTTLLQCNGQALGDTNGAGSRAALSNVCRTTLSGWNISSRCT